MKNGVVCLGEVLIDFIPTDQTNLAYEKCPGGAPANVAVGLAKFGTSSTFIGKIGDDVLGGFLKSTLEHYGVETSEIVLTKKARTGLTFVELDGNGERDFHFYIHPSADQFLSEDEIHEDVFREEKILHIGSISMIGEPAKTATKKAIRLAKEAGLWLSYDPNLRLSLWEDPKQAHETIVSVLPETDILKISEEELFFITGEEKLNEGVRSLKKLYNIPLILITLGEKGSIAFVSEKSVEVPAIKIRAVDTTGAGDAFVAGLLYGLNQFQGELTSLNQSKVFKIVSLANASGGLTASKKGAMTALPNLEAVKKVVEMGQ